MFTDDDFGKLVAEAEACPALTSPMGKWTQTFPSEEDDAAVAVRAGVCSHCVRVRDECGACFY